MRAIRTEIVRRLALGVMTAAAVGVAALGVGCGGGAAKPPPHARQYPVFLPQAGTLDIQVSQKPRTLRLTNTTGERFGPSTMWLNKRFNRPIPSLEVGQSLELPLADFVDEYGEVFRGGGLLAVREPERLVLAQLETTGSANAAGVEIIDGDGGETLLVGLVVVDADEEGLR